jgi:hypothetical protein
MTPRAELAAGNRQGGGRLPPADTVPSVDVPPSVNCAGAASTVPATFSGRRSQASEAIRFGGERGLYAATIEQAWLDAQRPLVRPGSHSAGSVTPEERREARALLTAERGEWADSREYLCNAAGIDAEALRRAAVVMLEGRA